MIGRVDADIAGAPFAAGDALEVDVDTGAMGDVIGHASLEVALDGGKIIVALGVSVSVNMIRPVIGDLDWHGETPISEFGKEIEKLA